MINVIINKKIPTQALVDTCAGSSCVNEQYVRDNKMTINCLAETDDLAFTIADKSTIKVLGKAHIELTIGNEIFDHSFHVISNLSVDIILGDDFLEMNDAIVPRGDFQPLKWNDSSTTMYERTSSNNSDNPIRNYHST